MPFLRAGIPGLLLWHFTDQFYHTDGDRLEMVSSETLENVSVCAAVTAMALTTADHEMTAFFAGELERAALDRIREETGLSRTALARGGDPAEELQILRSWIDWYLSAVDTFRDMEAGGTSENTELVLTGVRESILGAGRAAMESLGG